MRKTFVEWAIPEKKTGVVKDIKNHTCEEGSAHLRNSLWHLLKKLLKWPSKNKIILTFTKLHFLKKNI